MSVSSYLNSLKQKHTACKEAIRSSVSNSPNDENNVRNLKKQKLQIKEKIDKIELQQTAE